MTNKSLGNKEVMASNIRRHLDSLGLNVKEFSERLNFKYTTVLDWTNAKTYPRIDKIEMMAKFFNVDKSDLVEEFNPYNSYLNKLSNITSRLTPTRQQKVYNYAQHQLDEQENILILEEYRDIQLQSKVSAGTGVLDLDPQHTETLAYNGKVPKVYDLAFQVKGDSMEPTFRDGEILFVEKIEDAINGAIMVVQIDDEAFVKKVYVEGETLRLVSLNKAYKDIIANGDNRVSVVGKVVF